MIKRILVPMDGSAFAEWALPTAISLAIRARGELRLVRVVDGLRRFGFPPESDRNRADAEVHLESVAERVREVWPGPISVDVRRGAVAAELEAAATEWRADLVVMSTHGRAGLSRLWMGSVAARCVEAGFSPVLLIRPPDLGTMDLTDLPWVGRIVVPLDGSEVAEHALENAASLARVFGVHVVLIRVFPEGVSASSGTHAAGSVEQKRDLERAQARSYLEQQVARFRRARIHAYGMLLGEPDPAESIGDRVEGDLVVMATRGHERFSRVLLGSVTDKVVRAGTCPVLVVPPARVASDQNGRPMPAERASA